MRGGVRGNERRRNNGQERKRQTVWHFERESGWTALEGDGLRLERKEAKASSCTHSIFYYPFYSSGATHSFLPPLN